MNFRLVLALVPFAVVVACGSGGTAGPSPAPTVTVTAVPSTTSAAASTAPAPAGSPKPSEPAPPTTTKQVRVDRNPSTPPKVTGVRFAAHGAYDRLVIDLDGPMTGYTVRRVDKLVEDGSGETVEVQGGAYLQVTLYPANAHDDAGTSTWKGPRKVAAKLPNLAYVVNNGDFEAVVSIGLVLDHKAGFRVLEQSGPNRLVIDIAH